ncbi:CRISPR-associated protein Csx16 [Pasteurella atlantica]|uniref:CRISPR-associated protein Csx16 n=2 Tax=Pasteurellaceae TaxID=712 RepID=A0ACC6HPH0_9PAST|nr:CRISPR-associated protein Csx16 [Pasteurella atlantica]MDP8052784.1 CRISPR-associated protein Csx16 [Pasteurella atlantica]MDP8106081.1 CRISPR-associated protein Csx16 [Pasteurella atlantica]MDP8149471.1 CRISPR-associated protein Csx16 [Pasteurella atlantica]
MKTYFVSRHQGAIDWIKTQDIKIDHFIEHLDVDMVKNGDVVIGTLPIHIAAQVCKKEAKFYFLSINVHKEQRGQELNKDELIKQECKLQQFIITEVV